ncbi:alanine racemase [Maritalea mobilis]|uniref:Alanine racemase n=1 Tax=Maritalea mobilis TaxID=483324 RepID=A0A4R6VKN9_9HYPH|nr:alanine racemase [Maritalea mobilis]TDQ63657.1 alanine racemase [Maritalea mobilis]
MTDIPASSLLSSGHLTIDLNAIARNWAALDKISPGTLTAAVVKSNAYGLGLEEVAKALFKEGAQFFFVANPEEGLRLRAALPAAHIFVLGGLWPRTAEIYAQARLMPVLNSMAMLEEWLAFCVEHGEAYPSSLHFDTGMNRLGFRLSDVSWVRQQLERTGYQPQMIMSHLACADQPTHEKNRTQLAFFQSIMAHFPDIPASLANSAGLMGSKQNHFQLVRPGIALYGGRAISGRTNPLSHVVNLDVPILQVRDGKTGETVGYGGDYTLQRDSRIAIAAIGYGDGFLRANSSATNHMGARVAVKGQLVPVLGRISMDLTAIDVTDLGPNGPVPGEMVEILGPNVSVDDIADASGTIGYEILTDLQGRYRRSYVGGAE